MDTIWNDLSMVQVYFDDILIEGKDFSESRSNLVLVLRRFSEYNVKLNYM